MSKRLLRDSWAALLLFASGYGLREYAAHTESSILGLFGIIVFVVAACFAWRFIKRLTHRLSGRVVGLAMVGGGPAMPWLVDFFHQAQHFVTHYYQP